MTLISKFALLALLLFCASLLTQPSDCRIVFDCRAGIYPYGGAEIDSLIEVLWDIGYIVDVFDTSDEFWLSDYAICFLPFPNYNVGFTTGHIKEIQEFIYYGGLAIIQSDHGGCWEIDSSITFVNNLLSEFPWSCGVLANYDLVFDSTDYYDVGGFDFKVILVHLFLNHPYTYELDTIVLGLASSINVTSPSVVLARGDEDAFSASFYGDTVYFIGFPSVITLSHYGIGNLLIISDSNLFDSYPLPLDTIPIFRRYDNLQLALNIFDCSNTPQFTFSPPINGVVSCFERDTLWWEVSVANYSAIDTSILAISLNGMRLDTSPSFIILDDTSFAVCITDYVSLFHGDSIWVCIDSIADVDSFFPYDSFCYPIAVDHAPPVLAEISPSPDTSLDWFDSISVLVIDSLAGLDTASVILVVNGDTFYLDDPLITLIDGRLTLHLDASDSLFIGDSIINIFLYCCDQPDVCEPNCLEYNWSFISNYVGIAEALLPRESSISTYPNPFNSSCLIDGVVGDMAIYALTGRKIISWEDITSPILWNGEDANGLEQPSGIYLVRYRWQGNYRFCKIVLIR